MNTVTIPKKEYEKLKEAKRKLESTGYRISKNGKGKLFEKAFGVLKNSFGRGSSAVYVSKLRKAWRM